MLAALLFAMPAAMPKPIVNPMPSPATPVSAHATGRCTYQSGKPRRETSGPVSGGGPIGPEGVGEGATGAGPGAGKLPGWGDGPGDGEGDGAGAGVTSPCTPRAMLTGTALPRLASKSTVSFF